MNKPNKILIIGGDSYLAKSFIKYQGHYFDIHVISRIKTAYEKEIVCENLFDIQSAWFAGFDIVIHCAALVHQRSNQPETIYMKVNCELPLFIAGIAKTTGVRKFVQISTVSVYGKAEHIGDSSPELPVNAYGRSKLEADKRLLEMKDDKFEIIILRPPMIYGGGDAPGNMMRLIRLIAKGIPLPFRKLTNLRDFIHIGNLSHIIQLLITSNQSGVFLVIDGNSVNSSQLYNIITQKLGIKSRAFFLSKLFLALLKKVSPGVFEKLFGTLTIDITKLKNAVSYASVYSLEDGLTEMCEIVKKKI